MSDFVNPRSCSVRSAFWMNATRSRLSTARLRLRCADRFAVAVRLAPFSLSIRYRVRSVSLLHAMQ